MAGHGEGERLRRGRHRRRPQRPGRRRAAGQGRPAGAWCWSGATWSAARPSPSTPWGPDFKVTALSYVVSLMPPTILRELELERHGYKVHPQGPYFAPHPDGRHLQLADDPARRHKEIAKFSARDADAMRASGTPGSARLADVLGAAAVTASRRRSARSARATSLDLGQLGWRLRGVDVRHGRRHHPAVHVEHRRPRRGPLREPAAARACCRSAASSARGPGPARPGPPTSWPTTRSATSATAAARRLGLPRGRHGRGHRRAARGRPSASAPRCGSARRVERILVERRPGDRRGAELGRGARGPGRGRDDAPADHLPATSSTAASCRTTSSTDHRALEDPTGTVKVNLALDRLPEFTSHPEPSTRRARRHHRARAVASTTWSRRSRTPWRAGPRQRPFADICIPSACSTARWRPEGKHVMSMFTQWVPCELVGRARTATSSTPTPTA